MARVPPCAASTCRTPNREKNLCAPEGQRARLFENREFYFHGACLDHLQLLRGRLAQVEDASSAERPAIVDTDCDVAAICQIVDFHHRSEWQRPMGCGERVAIVTFATRSLRTFRSVPRRHSRLSKWPRRACFHRRTGHPKKDQDERRIHSRSRNRLLLPLRPYVPDEILRFSFSRSLPPAGSASSCLSSARFCDSLRCLVEAGLPASVCVFGFCEFISQKEKVPPPLGDGTPTQTMA